MVHVQHVQHVQHGQHGHAGRKAADRSRRARQRPLPGWAAEWGQYGIRVNAVAPGNVSSDNVVDFIGADRFTTWSGGNPLKRNATPEELAEVITFVPSERATSSPARSSWPTAAASPSERHGTHQNLRPPVPASGRRSW